MASAASAGPGPSGGREVPLWRLYLLRAGFLVLVVTGLFVHNGSSTPVQPTAE